MFLGVILEVQLCMLSHVLDEGEMNFVCLCIVQRLLADQAVAILCRELFGGILSNGMLLSIRMSIYFILLDFFFL